MSEKSKLESVKAGGETSSIGDERALERLVAEHTCGPDLKPEWCVYGSSHDGRKGILYWIKPSSEAQFIAKKVAQLNNLLGGGFASAEKTEWNPELKDKPVYYNDPEYLERVGVL